MRMPLTYIVLIAGTAYLQGCGGKWSAQKAIDDHGHQPSETSSLEHAPDSGPVHSLLGWQNVISLYVAKDAPDSVITAVTNAITTWNDAADHELIHYRGVVGVDEQTSLFSALEDNQTTLYYESKWTQHTGKSTNVLGTTVWENAASNDNVIVKGDIILNAQSYEFVDAAKGSSDNVEQMEVVDAETVVLHELGHLLGLNHVTESEDSASVMHAQTSIGMNNYSRELSDGDIRNLRSIYLK